MLLLYARTLAILLYECKGRLDIMKAVLLMKRTNAFEPRKNTDTTLLFRSVTMAFFRFFLLFVVPFPRRDTVKNNHAVEPLFLFFTRYE